MLSSAKDRPSPARILLTLRFNRAINYQSKASLDKRAKWNALIRTMCREALLWMVLGLEALQGALAAVGLEYPQRLPQWLTSQHSPWSQQWGLKILTFSRTLYNQNKENLSCSHSLTCSFLFDPLSRRPDSSGHCSLPQNVAVFCLVSGSQLGHLYGGHFASSSWAIVEFTNWECLGSNKVMSRKGGTVLVFIGQLFIYWNRGRCWK